MDLELLFLGSGNAFAPARYWSGFLANGRYLFDAPPTALPHLKKLGRSPDDVQAVFISHFHGDHFFGLPFLLLEYSIISQRTEPLWVVGPPQIEERLRAITDAGFPGVFARPQPYEVRCIEASDGGRGEVAGAMFEAAAVDHVDELDAFAYRVQIDGRTIAYSGDAVMSDRLVRLAQGTDVFVLECSCWNGTCGPHLSPDDVRALRKAVSPSTAFVATHLDGGTGDLGPGITLAEDLSVLRF